MSFFLAMIWRFGAQGSLFEQARHVPPLGELALLLHLLLLSCSLLLGLLCTSSGMHTRSYLMESPASHTAIDCRKVYMHVDRHQLQSSRKPTANTQSLMACPSNRGSPLECLPAPFGASCHRSSLDFEHPDAWHQARNTRSFRLRDSPHLQATCDFAKALLPVLGAVLPRLLLELAASVQDWWLCICLQPASTRY